MTLKVRYVRYVLVDVLVHHWPTDTAGCNCGWGVLGASFPDHVADMYEAAMFLTEEGDEHRRHL